MVYVPHRRYFTGKQIEELKKEINKPEYKKIIEPYEEREAKLESENYLLKEEIKDYRNLIDKLITSIKHDHIDIFVSANPIKASFYDISDKNNMQVSHSSFQKVTIPVKEKLKETMYNEFYEIKRRHYNKFGGDE